MGLCDLSWVAIVLSLWPLDKVTSQQQDNTEATKLCVGDVYAS